MAKILIVDDDPEIRGLLRIYLAAEGMEVREAADGPAAVAAWEAERPDLVILDIMLPGCDGLEVCRRIRQASAVPIIFLTGKAEEIDQLLGFGFGGDDYVTKPFSPRMLTARVKALLRRASGAAGMAGQPAGVVRFGDFAVDFEGFTVTKAGSPVDLTAKEFQLLRYFLAHRGRVLTKRQLVTGAWGEEYLGDDAVLMVHLSHLRQKLGEDAGWIRTIRGVGYKFLPEDEGALR